MRAIPHRIPPLRWRQPAFLWTPIALAIAIGWPAALFSVDSAPQRLALVAGAAVFALALITLGASWAMGKPPRARRIVVLHVVIAGAIAALVMPFVLTEVLAAVAGDGETFSIAMSLAMTPLALVVGLPITLVSGIMFAWLALVRQLPDDREMIERRDVQPFR
jgi:hypothetical protein